jgi:signal transduction histidine kinase
LKRVRVIDLLCEVEQMVVAERGVRLTIDTDDTLLVDADERLLVSAVSNLAQNAFKYTKNGGAVMLRARSDGASVFIEVEDECGGLPPGKIDELFQPYVQKGGDRRGIGLGLCIAREAVQAHGGDISARDIPGKGCVFVVRLPAAR